MPPQSAVKHPPRTPRRDSDPDHNRVLPQDRPVHEWYRFVLSYPPHLVRTYLERFDLPPGARVLDPFCGTGTTVVEAKKLGLTGWGTEANPVAYFASTVKVNWTPDPDALRRHATEIAEAAGDALAREGIYDLPFSSTPRVPLRKLSPDAEKLLLTASIDPLPLHKALVLLEHIDLRRGDAFWPHQRLAFARMLVSDASNLKFGPEVGVGKPRADAAVVSAWLARVNQMASDLALMRGHQPRHCTVDYADARSLAAAAEPESVHAVITSPPYPNEKDYSRTTRLESVLLGFTKDKHSLRSVKKRFVRSNTRSMYAGDDDDRWVAGHAEIERIAREIEERRIALGKTSGFERRYAWLTKLYFGGMARHLADLRRVLAPGARLAYVVGDQASYLQVMIRTGEILADLAQRLGYTVESIDLFRTRLATATKEQLREEVVVLRWPGGRG